MARFNIYNKYGVLKFEGYTLEEVREEINCKDRDALKKLTHGEMWCNGWKIVRMSKEDARAFEKQDKLSKEEKADYLKNWDSITELFK